MTLPNIYWHCTVALKGGKKSAIINDMTLEDLEKTIVRPWRKRKPFAVSGVIVRDQSDIANIQICQTDQPQRYYADAHNAKMRSRGIADMATNRQLLPFGEGEDHTFDLLFDDSEEEPHVGEVDFVKELSLRLPRVAGILGNRSRKDKPPFCVSDEYDVQDLLHAMLRGYLRYSVQENPLPMSAGTKSSRADISIQELGIIIEVKFVRGPSDQRRIFEELTQDLTLYTEWPHLKDLYVLIYNSGHLKDPEALLRLNGEKLLNDTSFTVHVLLA